MEIGQPWRNEQAGLTAELLKPGTRLLVHRPSLSSEERAADEGGTHRDRGQKLQSVPGTAELSLFENALAALENLPAVAALRESTLVYPFVNAAHLIGIALLSGAIVPLDLRLVGWRRGAGAVDQLSSLLLPVAIFGFALAAGAGLLLFATDARAYAASPLFQPRWSSSR